MKLKTLAILGMTVLLTACGQTNEASTPKEEVVTEGSGGVIATSVAVAEILDALEVEVVGVPTTAYELPDSMKDAIEVGSPMSPDLEIIKSLDPTVVVSVDTLGSDYIALFEENKIPSEFVSLESIDGLKDAIVTLGERFEKEDKATTLVETIEKKEQAIKDEVASLNEPNVLVLFGAPGATMIATKTSYIGSLVDLVGGNNIIDEEASSFVTLNKEYIATLNPDQILVMVHALPEVTKAALEEEMATDTMWQSLEAVRDGRVVFLDHNYFGMSADLKVTEALDLLKEIVHNAGE